MTWRGRGGAGGGTAKSLRGTPPVLFASGHGPSVLRETDPPPSRSPRARAAALPVHGRHARDQRDGGRRRTAPSWRGRLVRASCPGPTRPGWLGRRPPAAPAMPHRCSDQMRSDLWPSRRRRAGRASGERPGQATPTPRRPQCSECAKDPKLPHIHQNNCQNIYGRFCKIFSRKNNF